MDDNEELCRLERIEAICRQLTRIRRENDQQTTANGEWLFYNYFSSYRKKKQLLNIA